MSLQDLGAIGELVGGVAVVLSLVYIAYQIRLNSRQLEQNSRHLEATMYFATGDAFSRWWALIAHDESLARIWQQGLVGETLGAPDRMRFQALLGILFVSYENNFHQLQIGSVRRNTMEIGRDTLVTLLASPAVRHWWEREGARVLTPEFRAAVEALVAASPPRPRA